MSANTRIVILVSIIFSLTSCSYFNASRGRKRFKSVSYTKAEYGFSFQYPQSWQLIDQANSDLSEFFITVFKGNAIKKEELPLGIHTDMKLSYVAVWPHGLSTELPKSHSISLQDTTLALDLNFTVDRKGSRLLLLKDGSIWAYFLKPKRPPKSWSNFGFIYAQVGSTESTVLCYKEETGKELPIKDCLYSEKAQIVRNGNIIEEDAEAIRYILESMNFNGEEKEGDKPEACHSVELKKPLKNMVIRSPLTLEGKVKGNWYYEGTFIVKLYDSFGSLLAKDQAEAKTNWMTNKPVPFEAVLKFNPTSGSGRLVFQKANPSGLKKNSRSCSIPVKFSGEGAH